jgi:phospholipase/lecithinase/hemolysin
MSSQADQSCVATDKTPLLAANGEEGNAQLRASISHYNDLITSNLDTFKSRNSDVKAEIVDTHVAFDEAITNPTEYGAPDALCYNGDGKSCVSVIAPPVTAILAGPGLDRDSID